MAKLLGTECFDVAKICIHDGYTVDVYKKHYVLTSSGAELLIDDTMIEVVTPDYDLTLCADGSDDLFWATDEVKAVCREQFDEETIAEWNEFTEEEKEAIIDR